jgi:hypothetical protein
VPDVGYIRPGGDASSDDLAEWAGHLRTTLESSGHRTFIDVSQHSPCDRDACMTALAAPTPLLFFFGHGNEDALLGSHHEAVVDKSNVSAAAGKTLVSVACEVGLDLGPHAVQAGARAHLAWDVLLLWLARPAELVAYGEAIVRPLSHFGRGGSISEVADELRQSLNGIARRYRRAPPHDHNAKLAYYAAAAAAGQITIHGDRRVRPLAEGSVATAFGWARWRGTTLVRSALDTILRRHDD